MRRRSSGGIGWFHISLGAMLFGGSGAFVLGSIMMIILLTLVVCAGIFYGLRRIFRWAIPVRGKRNECSQELLDYWSGKSKIYPPSARI